jgi:hypothetical protein
MQGISFVVSPIRDHACFKKPQFQGLLGNNFFQLTRFTAKGGHLTRGSRTSRITGKPPLASFQKLLRPFIIDALGNAFTAAQLGDALLTTQSIQHNADLFFSRVLFAGRPAKADLLALVLDLVLSETSIFRLSKRCCKSLGTVREK